MFFLLLFPALFRRSLPFPKFLLRYHPPCPQHQLAVLAFRAVASASQPPFYYSSSYSSKFASICLSISASLVKAPEKARRAPTSEDECDEALFALA